MTKPSDTSAQASATEDPQKFENRLTNALRRAVGEAIARHHAAGLSVHIEENGTIVECPAKKHP